MNVSNENTTTPTENLKQINGTQDLENSELTKKINKINIEESPNLKPKQRSTSNIDIRTENKIITENEKENMAKSQKLKRNKTVCLETKKKFRVKFKNDFVQTIAVESYKKYNVDMSNNDGESGETTKCRCEIF